MLRDRSPLGIAAPFDLHFLGTPQAFVLSQDQTLRKKYPKVHFLQFLKTTEQSSQTVQRLSAGNTKRCYPNVLENPFGYPLRKEKLNRDNYVKESGTPDKPLHVYPA